MAAALATATAVPVLTQQTATFKSGVNMLALDVLVVDREGQPVLGLQPEDFTVTINNRARRVTSADLVRYETMPPPIQNLASTRSVRTPGFVGDDSRVFVLAIDDSSFLPGAIRPALAAAQRFIDNLRPSDMVGVYVFPFERPRIDITHDHNTQDTARRVARMFLTEVFSGRYVAAPPVTVSCWVAEVRPGEAAVRVKVPAAPPRKYTIPTVVTGTLGAPGAGDITIAGTNMASLSPNTTTVLVASYFMPVLVGKLLAIGASFLVNFSLSHFVVFRRR